MKCNYLIFFIEYIRANNIIWNYWNKFNDDITLFMNDINKLNKIKYNINNYCLCLDPPWTGVFYKIENELDLYLSNINILDFIKNINIRYIALKVPFNYNFKYLYKMFYNVVIYRLSGIYLVLITK